MFFSHIVSHQQTHSAFSAKKMRKQLIGLHVITVRTDDPVSLFDSLFSQETENMKGK